MFIDPELTEAFNAKPKLDINRIKTMTPAQLDNVKHYGSAAENLLLNKDFALFVHHYKFDLMDEIGNVKGYTEEDNSKRVALSQHLVSIEKFVANLQQAVYYKNRVVRQQSLPEEKGQ